MVRTGNRVHNAVQLHRFEVKRSQMECRDGIGANERLLWHGTGSKAKPADIYDGECGFDFRMANGGHYGRGTYFAEVAVYSNSGYAYASTVQVPGKGTSVACKQLFLARVLVGDAKDFESRGSSALKRPPTKDGSTAMYDSVCGNLGYTLPAPRSGPAKMFVTYDRSQAYPQYLVSYT